MKAKAAPASSGDSTGIPSCFVRKSFKYWALPRDLPIIKAEIAKHCPPFRFKEGASDVVQSIYLDNDEFDLYCNRLLRLDSSRLIRIRWYGDDMPPVLFIEQKLHKNTWQGDVSVKKRFTLPRKELFTFLEQSQPSFEDEMEAGAVGHGGHVRQHFHLDEKKMNLEQLPREIQDRIQNLHLTPRMMIRYQRTRFQIPDDPDPPVRIGLDENVRCASVDSMTFDWASHVNRLDDSEKYKFPFAILEIKVKLDSTPTGDSLLPDWAQTLVDRGLIMHVHKFSKYAQSTSTLYWDNVNIVPKWLSMIPKFVYQAEDSAIVDLEQPVAFVGVVGVGAAANVNSIEIGHTKDNSVSGSDDSSSVNSEDNEMKSNSKVLKAITKPRIVPPADAQLFKIQPKEFFANERTFLQWVRSSILIALLGVAILSMGINGEWISGLVLVVASMLIMLRALRIFLKRAKALRTRQNIEIFDDKIGPFSLVLAFVLATACYSVYAVVLVELPAAETVP